MESETIIKAIPDVLVVLEVALLFLTLMITTRETISETIHWYQVQCFILAIVTGLAAVRESSDLEAGILVVDKLVGMIVLLPVVLMSVVEPLLKRATLSLGQTGWPVKPRRGIVQIFQTAFQGRALSFKGWTFCVLPTKESLRELLSSFQQTEPEKRAVEREWRKQDTRAASKRGDKLIFVLLLGVALLVAFLIIPANQDIEKAKEAIGLAVSLCLHLVGLYNMVVRGDIISQAIGLLIMDHGLYLAVVKIVAIPVPATFFVTALYFYTFITAIILYLMLPQVHRWTETINLEDIARSSLLKETEPRRCKPAKDRERSTEGYD